MIKFHDPAGTPHFGQATITRTTSVNGGLSLTGEVFAGGDVLNGLDYGWWLNFDNEKYVITYKKLSDDTNTVVFDAVQQFFWDFAKVALHAQYTGSHEYTFYLGQLFDKSGYTYKNDVTVPAFEKENWGYKNKLDLFNDIIDQAGVEFEVHNETVHIAKQIGSDLTSFARKGINLSDLTEEMKISDFATYAKGYGAFKDAEDQSKGRLEVEYRSELAKQFGDLEMDPIVDERYTIADNLIAALKKQVDATYTVSMTMNIYDLENAGYPNYEAPKVGDWILAIDEALNFKRKIRIIQLEEQFDVTGKRIGYTATCGDLSIVDQYTHLQSSLDSKVQRIQESVDNAVSSANGKSTNYYGAKEPTSANEGDLWFDQSDSDPDKWSIKQWVNGRWEQITLNPGEVDAKVDVAKKEAETAVENAKSASDKADQLAAKYDDTNALANQALEKAVGTQSDASIAVAKAESTASEFGKVDQKADSALTAASNAQSDASSAVAKAESTASEFGRVDKNAGSALASALSAQSDASTAVTQASSAAADSKDAKQIAGAVSQSYKTLTDGSTMTLAELESGLAAKLTRTDLDGYATETWAQNQINVSADAINTTLSSVKSTVDGQTTSINDLKADSSSFKSQFTTVNNTIGKQTTDISSLQASSKELTTGFNTLTTDNTTNKNDISQLKQTATEVSSTLETVQTQVQDSSVGTNLFSQSTATGGYVDGSTGNIMSPSTTFNENVSDYISVRASSNYTFQMWGTTPSGAYYWYGIGLYDSDKKFISRMSNVGRIYSSDTEEYVSKTLTTTSTTAYVRVSFRKYNNYKVKLEKGSVATDYSVNPEDTATVTAVSKLSQTVDGIKLDVSKKIEQKDLDGYSTQTWSQGQITAAKNEISASVETVKQQVDNLQIGGRNLVPNFGNTYSGWAGWVRLRSNDKWEILEIDGAKVLHIVPSDLTIASGVYNWYPVRRTDGLDVNGKEWSASLEIKGAVTLSRMGIENSTNTSGNYTSQKISDPSIWTKLESHGSHKGDISSGGAYVIYAFALNSDGFYIRYPTVNAGNLVMQWQDAPESQATIDWTKSMLDVSEGKVSAQVESVKTDLNNATNTLNNNIANATADMATETWTQSQINLTADGINGTISSVKSTVDGQTTSINDLKADSSSFKSQFTTVNDTLGKHTTDIGTLQTTSNELSSIFSSLSSDNTTNKNDISQLKQTATEFSSTLETVKTQVQNIGNLTHSFNANTSHPGYTSGIDGTLNDWSPHKEHRIDYAPIDPTKSYFIEVTATVPATSAADNFNWLGFTFYDRDKKFISRVDTNGVNMTVSGQSTTRIAFNYSDPTAVKSVVIPANAAYVIPQARLYSDGVVTWGEYFATQTWTQNQIKMTADDINGTISSVKSTVDGHTTSINELKADSSGFKAQFTTVNNTIGKHTTDIGTLQASTKSLSASFDSLNTDNNTNKHDISQLQQTASSFSSTLMTVQQQVQDSAVGTNLYRDTRDFDNPNGVWNRYGYWTKTGEIYSGMTAVSTANDWDGLSQTWAVKKGETYTFSIYAKYESGTGNSNLYCRSTDDLNSNNTDIGSKTVSLNGTWQRVFVTFVVTADGYVCPRLERTTDNANKLIIAGPKLERGSVMTDYSTSPLDNATITAVSKISQTVNSIETTVRGKVDNDTYQSKVDQLNNQITSVVGQVNNLGQTNIIYNSEFTQNAEGWSKAANFYVTSGIWSDHTTGGMAIHTITGGDQWYALLSKKIPVLTNSNTQYSASCDVIISSTSNDSYSYAQVMIEYLNESGTRSSYKSYDIGIRADSDANNTIPANKSYTVQLNGSSPDANAKYVRMSLRIRGIAYVRFKHPMLVIGDTVGQYQADTVGSAEIALMNNNINLKVSKDGVVNAINISPEGTQIYGNKLYITADTYIDNAVIKDAMIANLSANKLTAGTINAATINVINLNANNITTGTIKGSNLSINLNTGNVEFQAGRIHSSDNAIDININNKYISVADKYNRVFISGGEIQMIQPTLFSSKSTPYVRISNAQAGASLGAATFWARDYFVVTHRANDGNIFTSPMGEETFSGISGGHSTSGWQVTKIGGAERGVLISGGKEFTDGIGISPYIRVGDSGHAGTGMNGSNISMQASYIYLKSTHSTSHGANAYLAPDGALVPSNSAAKYKTDIVRSFETEMGNKLLEVPVAHWKDKEEVLAKTRDSNAKDPETYFGMIADDLDDAGLTELVEYDEKGAVRGIQYDRVALSLIPLIRNYRDHISELENEVKKMKEA